MSLYNNEKILGHGYEGYVYKEKNEAIKVYTNYMYYRSYIEHKEKIINLKKQYKLIKNTKKTLKPNFIGINNNRINRYNTIYEKSDYIGENLRRFKAKNSYELFMVLFKITMGIYYLHKNKIAHRDIKPENILYNKDKKQIKIIDFGFSKNVNLKGKNLPCGTLRYAAPELKLAFQYKRKIENKQLLPIDIYALLITFHVIIENNKQLLKKESDDNGINYINEKINELNNFCCDIKYLGQRPSIKNILKYFVNKHFSLLTNIEKETKKKKKENKEENKEEKKKKKEREWFLKLTSGEKFIINKCFDENNISPNFEDYNFEKKDINTIINRMSKKVNSLISILYNKQQNENIILAKEQIIRDSLIKNLKELRYATSKYLQQKIKNTEINILIFCKDLDDEVKELIENYLKNPEEGLQKQLMHELKQLKGNNNEYNELIELITNFRRFSRKLIENENKYFEYYFNKIFKDKEDNKYKKNYKRIENWLTYYKNRKKEKNEVEREYKKTNGKKIKQNQKQNQNLLKNINGAKDSFDLNCYIKL